MLIQYAYIKPRSQFGKQCLFKETDPIVETNILPEPELMQNYIHQNIYDHGVQTSAQFAFHEMQTTTNLTKESGILHLEGGWPKEINMKDEEAVLRFRRRVEKDENWVPRMKKLIDPMEHNILQNNAINIYDHYFDDIEPTRFLPLDLRISKVYSDPQSIARPISHLSWSGDAQNRLVASYSFRTFETEMPDVNPSSYIWDIENPNTPIMRLRSLSPLIITEFNPHDSSILISGLMSGQVCNWDTRIGDRPVQMSHRQFSHRNPANQAHWITSKTHTEFFSASTDGTIRWWDTRNLKQPTNMIVMDLDNPHRSDIVKSIGVTALHFEPTMPSKFLVGMDNGMAIKVNLKAVKPVEKLATRFECHVGPVIAIDRNPFATKNFLTVGDMNVKIWSDDIRENSIIAISEQNVGLNGACWSKCKYSMFFTINTTGLLKIYDILTDMDSPVTTFRVCDECLTAIAPHEHGQLLAVGSYDGKIYLVECSEEHTTKIDKAKLTAVSALKSAIEKGNNYLERCSRFEKIVEIRLKEIRAMQPSKDFAEPALVTKDRRKKRDNKKNTKDKAQVMKKDEHKKRPRRKVRDPFFEDLVNTELAFFNAVKEFRRFKRDDFDLKDKERSGQPEKFEDAELQALLNENLAETLEELVEALNQFASYPYLEEIEQLYKIRQEVLRKKKKIVIEPPKEEDEVVSKWDKFKRERSRMRYKFPSKALIEEIKIEEEEAAEAPLVKKRVKKRTEKILKKVCAIEVCKPEICCADMEEKRAAKLQAQFWSKEKKSPRDMTPQLRKLSYPEPKLLERSAVSERRILEKDGFLPDVLADEVEEARREVRAWQERVMSGKRDFWLPRTTGIVYEKLEKKKKKVDNGDDESPERDAGEEKSDFRQLAETSLKWKSGSESEDKILLAREKSETGKLNPHFEKCAQEGDTYPTVVANTGEATETTASDSEQPNRNAN